jgi:alkanesulfonate monooxygenase SsuD/methylene tetrahydromethanopterin reductase-like flavin-dependent oxidoreductase (luciferase family)
MALLEVVSGGTQMSNMLKEKIVDDVLCGEEGRAYLIGKKKCDLLGKAALQIESWLFARAGGRTTMDLGIGLPATTPGVRGQFVLDWAVRAEAKRFSSLGIVDRLVYPGFESLITLAAVAGATSRIRLMTTILIAPLRGTGMFAKQVNSLDALSGGRLTLGLAVGGREDDFLAAPASFHTRGRRFEEQLQLLERLWSGRPASEEEQIGPPPASPGGPEVLIGGNTPAALHRVGRWGQGVILGGQPRQMSALYTIAVAAWQEAGKAGKPRLVGGMYYALGPDAGARAYPYISQFYAFAGKMADVIASHLADTPQKVQDALNAYADIGVDELILWPCIAEIDQMDRLEAITHTRDY